MSARSIFFVFARKGGGVVKRTSNDITAGNGRERFMIAVKVSLNIFLFTFFCIPWELLPVSGLSEK